MHDEQPTAILTQGLSDLRWGVDAAAALYGIWSHDNPSDKGRVFGWNDFSKHLERRAARRSVGTPSSSDFAEAIFSAVRLLGNAAKSDAEQRHALALAITGLALPHGSKQREVEALLALQLPVASKRGLLEAAARARPRTEIDLSTP